jgi:hypothetical protein
LEFYILWHHNVVAMYGPLVRFKKDNGGEGYNAKVKPPAKQQGYK